jgi:hypothetical protein
VYIPETTSAEVTVLPQISECNLILFAINIISIAQASIAENFNGGITLFDDEKLYGIFLNMVV